MNGLETRRSIRSPWIWRGLSMMAMLALGIAITFLSSNKPSYAAAWAVIAAGWFGISMWLWREHLRASEPVRKPQAAA